MKKRVRLCLLATLGMMFVLLFVGSASAGCLMQAEENGTNCKQNCWNQQAECGQAAMENGEECTNNCRDYSGNMDQGCVDDCNSAYNADSDACKTEADYCHRACVEQAEYETQYCSDQHRVALQWCEQQFNDCNNSGGIACQAQYEKCAYEVNAAWGY
jgi:hypothetical protein